MELAKLSFECLQGWRFLSGHLSKCLDALFVIFFFSVSHAPALGFPLLQVMLPSVLWLCVFLSRVWPCLLYIHP